MPASLLPIISAPAWWRRDQFARMPGIRARASEKGVSPCAGITPTVRPTTVRRSAISWISSAGASTPSAVQNETCSSMSAPAATASAIALAA